MKLFPLFSYGQDRLMILLFIQEAFTSTNGALITCIESNLILNQDLKDSIVAKNLSLLPILHYRNAEVWVQVLKSYFNTHLQIYGQC
jgi:hypothetical protein